MQMYFHLILIPSTLLTAGNYANPLVVQDVCQGSLLFDCRLSDNFCIRLSLPFPIPLLQLLQVLIPRLRLTQAPGTSQGLACWVRDHQSGANNSEGRGQNQKQTLR